MRQGSRRTMAIVLSLVLALSISGAALAQEKTTITFGVPWGLDVFGGVLLELVDAYNAQSQTVQVQIESGWGTDKLLVAAAGGTGPDVVGFGGPSLVRQFGEEVLRPVDAMIDRYGIELNRFLPDSVTQIQGRTYGIKMFVDPNFPLIYNETLLQEAGIAEPPRSIPELDELNPKLTRRLGDGQVERLGMLPWNLGEDHLFQSWGPAFGATRIWDGDENSGRYNFTTPEWQATFAWIADYFQRQLPDIGIWGDVAWWQLDWFIDGRVVMGYHVSPTLTRLKQATPYNWKAAPPVSNPGGAELPVWFGGFSFGVGKFTTNEDAAFDFLEFITWNDRGSEIIGRTGLIAAYQGAAGFDVLLQNDPEWTEFLSVLPRAFGNFYYPIEVGWGDAAAEFVDKIRAGASVPDALAEMERILNAQVAERGLLAG